MSKNPTDLRARRMYPRRKFRRGVGCLIRGEYFVGTGEEIGEGGLAFWATRELAIGDRVVLSFQIPNGDFYCIQCEVRNQRESLNGAFNYGCSFLKLGFEGKRQIRNFVTARSESET